MITAEEIIGILDLAPLPGEGGLYRETYRSAEIIPAEALPQRYAAGKSFCTAIYYLVTDRTHSRLHRLPTDEIFHFHLGDPVEMLQLHADGGSEVIWIGPDIAAGQRPQVVVPGGTWQGLLPAAGRKLALMSVTVAPGFDVLDYEPGDTEELIRAYPDRKELIRRLS